eukprot:gene2337-4630_t
MMELVMAIGCFLPTLLSTAAASDVVINEVADKGTSGDYGVCEGNFQLFDDNGAEGEDAYTFPEGSSLASGEKLVLCRKDTFQFKIGTDDTITLADGSGNVVDSTGVMPGLGRDNKVWARIPDVSGNFVYSGTPTAGAANELSDPPTVPPTTSTAAPVTQAPSSGELSDPNSACGRLRAEHGLDCNACLESLPTPVADQATCRGRTVEDDTQAEVDAIFGEGKEPRKLFQNTSFLFATDNVWRIEFDLAEADWESMTSDPAAEEWHTGSVRFVQGDGDATQLINPATGTNAWEGVGIRFKGFFGSLRICLTGMVGDCTKLSYKLKFNHVDPDARFFGLKMLQLHAASSDVSKMRERLSYGLFREMGVPAPRSSFSVVSLKVGTGADAPTTRLGVHLLTEVIDGRFTDSFFDGGDGNLYKELWPGAVGEDGTVNEANFINALDTNEEDPDATALVMFSEALNAANDDYTLATVVKKWTSAKRWAAQMAVDRAIEHWDGPINFRSHDRRRNRRAEEGAHWTHNFFLYEEDRKNVSKREFDLVPWDLDNSWIDPNQIPQNIGNRSSTNCIQCETFATTGGLSQSMPPSCFKMVRAFARGLRRYYMDAAERLLAGPLQPCRINAKLDRWAAALKPHLDQDEEDGLYVFKQKKRKEKNG